MVRFAGLRLETRLLFGLEPVTTLRTGLDALFRGLRALGLALALALVDVRFLGAALEAAFFTVALRFGAAFETVFFAVARLGAAFLVAVFFAAGLRLVVDFEPAEVFFVLRTLEVLRVLVFAILFFVLGQLHLCRPASANRIGSPHGVL
jgi:hypothetical protein